MTDSSSDYLPDNLINASTDLSRISPIRAIRHKFRLNAKEKERLNLILATGIYEKHRLEELSKCLNIGKLTLGKEVKRVKDKKVTTSPKGAIGVSGDPENRRREVLAGSVYSVLTELLELLSTAIEKQKKKLTLTPITVSTMAGILIDKLSILEGYRDRTPGGGHPKTLVWNIIQTARGERVRIEPGQFVVQGKSVTPEGIRKLRKIAGVEKRKLKELAQG